MIAPVHETQPVSVSAKSNPVFATLPVSETLPSVCNAWIISDYVSDAAALTDLVKSHGINCTRILSSVDVSTQITNILADHAKDPPDFIWVTLPQMASKNSNNARCHVAVRLVLYQQLLEGKQICIEGATVSNASQNAYTASFYIEPSWIERFNLSQSKVWWCSLGLQSNSSKPEQNCFATFTMSSMNLPQRYMSCCNQYGKHRGKVPKSTPQSHYNAVVKMLRESLIALAPAVQFSNSEPLLEVSDNFPVSTTSVTAASSSGVVPKKRSKAVGAKTFSVEDGPGEHTDVVLVPDRKWIEDSYDDCGDDLSAIKAHDDKDVFSVFEEVSSTIAPSDSECDSDLDDVFDSCFLNHCFPGSEHSNSENPYESEAPSRPTSYHFTDCMSMNAFLSKHEGVHDVFEMFGGKGLCTQIAVRRQLRTGPNWDITCDLDLQQPEQVAALWYYIATFRPRVVIAGPPCTAFGPWSRLNKIKYPEAYARALKVGLLFANLVAEVCQFQLSQGRHFIVENPWGSALWSLPSFVRLLNMPNVAVSKLAQCMTGLKDPQGIPTQKITAFAGSCSEIVCRLEIPCDGSHAHVALAGKVLGIARCKYAQTWTKRLCELIIEGIIATLRSQFKAYPAVSRDAYGGSKACKGCSCHAARHDPRHDRRPGICRFPLDVAVTWNCPACTRFLPSTHAQHSFDADCQWATAIPRHRGYERFPPLLRDPVAPASVAPAAATMDIVEPPPPVHGKVWTPVSSLAMCSTLEQCQIRDGWHPLSTNEVAITWTNGRRIGSVEPRYPSSDFPYRSSFGYFPDSPHSHGQWWQLEDRACALPTNNILLGFAIPTLVVVFHRLIVQDNASVPTEIKPGLNPRLGTGALKSSSSSSHMQPTSKAPPAKPPVVLAPPAPAEPHDQDPDIPAVAAEAEEPPQVDWSSFDMGRCLRALRSENPAIITRALKRLHLRLWHCSASRLSALLKAAGVPQQALKLVEDVCKTCSVCRMWQRPTNKAAVSSRLSEKLGEVVQHDLFFHGENVICGLLDEATRWTVAGVVAGKDTESLLRFITTFWIRTFGPMRVLLSDQEAGLFNEEAAVWAERHGITMKPKPVGSHAALIERHHQEFRDVLRRIVAQAEREQLLIPISDCVAEACFAKNALSNTGGFTPFQSLFGRYPVLLLDLEQAGQSAITDSDGSIAGANRHATRLRELALQSMLSATAASRLKVAESHKTRLAGQLLNLNVGDLIDIYRTPAKKELSGWRGPAKVLSTSRIEEGIIDILWGGRTLIARSQDVRHHMLFVYLLEQSSVAFNLLSSHLLMMLQSF